MRGDSNRVMGIKDKEVNRAGSEGGEVGGGGGAGGGAD